MLRWSKPSRWSYLHGYAFNALVCGMIVQMTVDLGGFNSGYYVGLMLVIFPVNVLLPWRSYHSAINGLFDAHRNQVGRVPVNSPFIARDIDTWDDYRALHRQVFDAEPPELKKGWKWPVAAEK